MAYEKFQPNVDQLFDECILFDLTVWIEEINSHKIIETIGIRTSKTFNKSFKWSQSIRSVQAVPKPIKASLLITQSPFVHLFCVMSVDDLNC